MSLPILPHAITRRRLLVGGTAAMALALAGCDASPKLENLNGLDLSDVDFGADFQLTDHKGQRRTLADFKGSVLLVFFGFTQCPDVCPTALFRATEVKELLGEEGKRIQVAFITIDPERDTPDVLEAYVTAFDPEFVGLYGSLEETQKTARDFKVFYAKVPTGSSYTMDHTALTYVYDAKGKLRLALRHNQTAEEYAEDIRQVLALG
ncbi:SCO family protein [Paracandidimonas soli]|uniref:Protein SCO1/2 n=1 Tax=Paracandidimonas soli TaxID=1917182 RepID=A0A4R3V114_9BURK|nr:SCO family protein [Paracandidimonas soli]TCU98415.1 protein SCO1/2 [Paracandidimonas soli]